MLTSRINNIFYEFQLPLTISQACLTKKIYIPRFCYHFSLRIAGNCRMCLVEEKSSLKPLASCAVTLLNGHIIYTNTEVVKKAREGVLEYLLINHPLDCPICDQGGECDLQDQTMVFGADRGRFYEHKRSTADKNLGFLIKTSLNRCIHCARCTRFLNEIAGTNELQLLGRGYRTEISNYVFNFVTSEISGNIIDLCPVGALTSKPYAFKARPWELFSVYTYDILDGFGSNIQLDFRGLDLMRVLPRTNRFLNEEWISDKTRFSYDAFNLQRLTNIYMFKNNNFQNLNWFEVLVLIKNIFFFKSNPNLSIDFGDFFDFESCLSLKEFSGITSFKYQSNFPAESFNTDFRYFFGLKNLDFLDINLDDIENFFYVIIDSNLRFESPILNLKLRKIFFEHENKIFIVGFISNFNFDFIHLDKTVSKIVLNFIVQNNEKKVTLTNNSLIFFDNCNYLSHNISNMVIRDFNFRTFQNFVQTNYFFLMLGQVEFSFFFKKNFVKIFLLHHVEDEFVDINDSFLKLLLPTSFYYEKPTSYVNNSFNFFNLLTHFSVKIPNTKPEWKIISAFNEFTNTFLFKKNIYNLSFFIPGVEFRLNTLFRIVFFETFFNKLKKISLITNFYRSNIVSRLSNIMNLCSNKSIVLNDYVYNITN